MSRIPVTLVTGFLGSGKTTFINAAMRAPDMSNVVVVINEFGEVGLDHQLVTSSNDQVIVLENGCLCCTVRSDLVGTLNALYHDSVAGRIPKFDRVVIETSGLAEPGSVLQAFLSEPTLDGMYWVATVITLVDCVNWSASAEHHDEVLRQVALADTILLTKADLAANSSKTDSVEHEIRDLNAMATVAQIKWDPAYVAALLKAPGFDAANPLADPRPWLKIDAHLAHGIAHEHHHDNDHDEDCNHHEPHYHLREKGVDSFVLIRDAPLSREELQFLLDAIAQNLGPGLLRVKGLVNIAEEPGRPAVLQGAQHLLHTMTWLDRWPDTDQRTRIVFITQGIVGTELKGMIETFNRVSERTFAARRRGHLAVTDKQKSER